MAAKTKRKPITSRFEMVDPSTLKANPRNPRRMSEAGMSKLRRVIRDVGFSTPVVVQEGSRTLIAGHQRTQAALAEKLSLIPAVFLEVDDETATRLLLADNRMGEEAEWEEGLLAELLAELGADLAGLVGFTAEEYERNLRHLSEELGTGRTMMKRRKVDWERFSVFHACVDNQLFAMDHLDYLASFGHVSPRGVPPKPPHSKLFVDSGLLQGAEKEGRRYLDRQEEVVRFAEKLHADWVAMMDIPPYPGILEHVQLTPNQAYDRQLRNAKEFAGIVTPVPRKVFTIQGPSLEVYERCARDYKGFVGGEDVIAIGGAKTRSRETDFICEVTAMVRDVFPANRIHLFGIAYPPTVAKAVQYGATSIDSASAASVHWNHVLLPVKRGDHYGVKKFRLEEMLAGEHVSIGGKLFKIMTAWNMVQGTSAVMMSAVSEELAIRLEMERGEETVPVVDPGPEPELQEEVD